MAEQSVEINQSLVALNTTLEKIPAALDALKQQLAMQLEKNNTATVKQFIEANKLQLGESFKEYYLANTPPSASQIISNSIKQMLGLNKPSLNLPAEEISKEEKVKIRNDGQSVNLISISEEILSKLKFTLKSGFKQGLQEFLDDNPDAFCCPKNNTLNIRRPRNRTRVPDKPPINIPYPPIGIPYDVPVSVPVENPDKVLRKEKEVKERALESLEKRQREIEEEVKIPKSIEIEIKQPEIEVPKPLAPSLPEQIVPSKATEVKLPETVTTPKEPSLRDKIKPAYGFENDMLRSDKFIKSTGWERFGRLMLGDSLYDTVTGETSVEDYLKNNWMDIAELLLLGAGGKAKTPGQRVPRPMKNVTPVEAKPGNVIDMPKPPGGEYKEAASFYPFDGKSLATGTAQNLPKPVTAKALPEPVTTQIPNPIESVTVKTVPDIAPKKITAQPPLTKAGQGLEPATKTGTTEFDISATKQFKPETQPLIKPEKATNLFEVAEPVPTKEVPEIREYLKELNEVSINLKNAVKQMTAQPTGTGNSVLNSVNDSKQTFNTFNTYIGAGEEIPSSRIKTKLMQDSFRSQF